MTLPLFADTVRPGSVRGGGIEFFGSSPGLFPSPTNRDLIVGVVK